MTLILAWGLNYQNWEFAWCWQYSPDVISRNRINGIIISIHKNERLRIYDQVD